jgi:ABC-type transport system substrate-binding protein
MSRFVKKVLCCSVVLLTGMIFILSGAAESKEKVVKYPNGDWKSMDPAFITGVIESYVAMNIHAGLVGWEYGTTKIVPDLAESWEISPDGTVYTFKLRKGAKFHQGFGEVTADDVKYSFDRVLDPKTGALLAKTFSMIKEIKVIDKYTVQFVLNAPFAPFMTRLTSFKTGGIIPKAAVDKFGDKFGMNPVGAGPFEWVSGTPGGEMVLKAFDGYYGGRPKLDRVVFPRVVDDSTAYVAFEGGDLDFVNVQDP